MFVHALVPLLELTSRDRTLGSTRHNIFFLLDCIYTTTVYQIVDVLGIIFRSQR